MNDPPGYTARIPVAHNCYKKMLPDSGRSIIRRL
jgi:hypothetical protein